MTGCDAQSERKEMNKQILMVLIGKKRTESIIEGLYYRSYDKNRIHVAASLDDAANILRSLASRGDTILFENDLPDNYNEE